MEEKPSTACMTGEGGIEAEEWSRGKAANSAQATPTFHCCLHHHFTQTSFLNNLKSLERSARLGTFFFIGIGNTNYSQTSIIAAMHILQTQQQRSFSLLSSQKTLIFFFFFSDTKIHPGINYKLCTCLADYKNLSHLELFKTVRILDSYALTHGLKRFFIVGVGNANLA